MANRQLSNAKSAKNDEFYTQYADIEKEVNAYLEFNPDVFRGKSVLLPCDDPEWSNFTRFFAQRFEALGLRKLVSTSFAAGSKPKNIPYWPTLWERDSPKFDAEKTRNRGKIFILEQDRTGDGRINLDDLDYEYLSGDGDFRSAEVKRLRDEADIIVTNPPFSLFRDFLAWIMEAQKQFLIIGSINAITYKEVFPLIKDNKMWLGATGFMTDMVFGVPEGAIVAPADKAKAEKLGYVGNYTRMGSSCWFTNMEHGRRHQPLSLMTAEQNIRYNKKLKGRPYARYDNYDAIEVPYVDGIPCDYDGAMGVPITFLDKYCPEQFDLLDCNNYRRERMPIKETMLIKDKDGAVEGKARYARILIKKHPITPPNHENDTTHGYHD